MAVSVATGLRIATQRIRELQGTAWIGIDGMGASGKSTFADQLALDLPGAEVIHVDDFARPDRQGWEQHRFVDQVLRPIRSGRPGRYQRWHFATNTPAEWVDVQPGRPIIVEGVSSTDVRLGVPWDFTVWLDAPAELRLQRARSRDGEPMLDRWLTDWIPSEEAYVAAQAPQNRVDLIIDATQFC